MPIYMRIEGPGGSSDIQGTVTQGPHTGWIAVYGFKLAAKKDVDKASCSSVADLVQRLGSAPTTLEQVEINKVTDLSTPGLLRWANELKERTVLIDFCTESSGEPFLQYKLHKARLDRLETTQSSSLDASTDDLDENLAITYKKVWVSYSTMDAAGDVADTVTYEYERPDDKQWLEPGEGDTEGGTGTGAAFTSAPGLASRAPLSTSEETDSLPAPEASKASRQSGRRLFAEMAAADLSLAAFTGAEAMSRCFQFELTLTSPDLDLRPGDIVGKQILFGIRDDDENPPEKASPDRRFSGFVREFRAGGLLHTTEGEEERKYTAIVVPWLWLLTKNTDCRVFQDQTVEDVVRAVFEARGIPSDAYRFELHGGYPKMEHCVQYRESDFQFVTRLLEEYGIYYYFEHDDQDHVLVVADDTTAYVDIVEDEVVYTTGTAREKQLDSWSHRYQVVGWNALYRDYNFRTATTSLEAKEPGKSELPRPDLPKADSFGLFDYPGRYSDKDGGKRKAKTRIESEEARFDLVEGGGSYDSFRVGGKFSVSEHECEGEASGSHVVVSIRHLAQDQSQGDDPLVLYQNSFRCVPSTIPFRPLATTPRPRVHGVQTAVVVGPSSDSAEEIHTDDEGYGCVRVQFHWDRLGKKGDTSSCWVRVAHTVAGKEWGFFSLPRVGQEVVVEFLDGDPDRPLIIGGLYNSDQKPPYALPENKTRSLFKSRSTKEGDAQSFNELRFEDKKDSEEIYFHAQKDFHRVVENDDRLEVGTDGEGSRFVTIQKDSELTIETGSRTETITEGAHTETVKQDHSLTVQEGDALRTIEQGSYRAEAGTEIELKVGDNVFKIDDGNITAEAGTKIELTVGGSTIRIESSGITIEASEVKVVGTTTVDGELTVTSDTTVDTKLTTNELKAGRSELG